VLVRLAGSDVLASFRDRFAVAPGETITLLPQADKIHLFDAASGLRIS
jgi:multiple sugar transport system ATP-binding protein